MNKKCPPGVICLENMTMVFLVIIILFVFYLVYRTLNNNEPLANDKHSQQVIINQEHRPNGFGFFTRPNYGYNNLPGDVLMNPYVPPLKDDRYLIPNIQYAPPGTVPINISTNVGAVDTSYRQTGLLTPVNDSAKILPLMGRPLFTNRNKWQYYTMSDQNNSVKLPIIRNGRSCTNEYGCDELYNGDRVYVEGYNQAFKITMYDNDTIKYIPFL